MALMTISDITLLFKRVFHIRTKNDVKKTSIDHLKEKEKEIQSRKDT